jgi:hypothetical protein
MIAARPGLDPDRDPSAPPSDIGCDTCQPGRMVLTREPRSPVLRVVGFTLWADALLTLILGVGSGALFVSAGRPGVGMSRHRADATAALVHVSSIPRSTIDAFEQTGTFDRTVLPGLSDVERSRTERILEVYDAAVAAESVIDVRRSIGIPIACLLLFVAGLYLTLKRDVWRCVICGHVKRVARRRSPLLPSLLSEPRTD